jgi:hypothetical protein
VSLGVVGSCFTLLTGSNISLLGGAYYSESLLAVNTVWTFLFYISGINADTLVIMLNSAIAESGI